MSHDCFGKVGKEAPFFQLRILHNTQLLNVNNYRISGIPFSPEENPFEATTKFFKDIMSITVNAGEIIVASHLPGTITVRIQGNRVELPPQMFVKVTPPSPKANCSQHICS